MQDVVVSHGNTDEEKPEGPKGQSKSNCDRAAQEKKIVGTIPGGFSMETEERAAKRRAMRAKSRTLQQEAEIEATQGQNKTQTLETLVRKQAEDNRV